MDGYVSVIKFAVLAFPLLAIFISSPFILWQYHKYGSISPLKSLLAYSFAFYLLRANLIDLKKEGGVGGMGAIIGREEKKDSKKERACDKKAQQQQITSV